MVEGGTNPGMDQKVLFHPREVVCGLDRHVPERGGRRTINMGVGRVESLVSTLSRVHLVVPVSSSLPCTFREVKTTPDSDVNVP